MSQASSPTRGRGQAIAVGRRLLFTLIAGALLAGAVTAVAAVKVPAGGLSHAESSSCRPGMKRAIIAGRVRCLRSGQACAAGHERVYKKYGLTCASGHLRKRSKPAPPTPAPPSLPPLPPPPAQPGYYRGTTSQLEVFEFEVNTTGDTVHNFVTGQVNEGCTPPANLSGGNFRGGLAPVTADGTFKLDFDYRTTVGESPATGHFTITGHFNGASATGTLQDSKLFSHDGIQYACGSGLQTWTATRSG